VTKLLEAEATAGTGQSDQVAAILGDIAERGRKLVRDFLARQQDLDGPAPGLDGVSLAGGTFVEILTRLMSRPHELARAQLGLWQDHARLWQAATQRMLGAEVRPVIAADRGDRRFKDPAWDDDGLFDFIKQSYLLNSKYLLQVAGREDGANDRTQQKLAFYTRQFVEMMAPSNFLATNPEVLRLTVETRGENLLRGLRNMLEDLDRGKGRLAVKMTDLDRFEVGRNIATTPGKVVFQTDLMQLIQYTPSTGQVHKRPLMIIPPWINKFYVLDLQPKNSLIKYCVDQGFTVFVLSWVNPDRELSHKGFEDYMLEGPLAALDAIARATGEREVNAVGYCLGGTLLAATLAWMREKGDDRIRSATFLTTLVDFADPGELGVFMDEGQLAALERTMARRGYLDGAEMAASFNLLRASDLIWSFVINNYLMGKDPFPFDLLYWNSDNTRMPAAMHSFYLRKCYHENAWRGRAASPWPACRSTSPGSTCRSTGSPPRRTTSPPGRAPTPRRGSTGARRSSWWPAPATSPAWSTRPPPASTATGSTTSCRPTRTPGSPAPGTTTARGGPTGRPGTPRTPATRYPPARPAAAGSRRSRTRPAPTS
jgi:polyhydroxyalkanoate synthase